MLAVNIRHKMGALKKLNFLLSLLFNDTVRIKTI
jgi:hypothetical protein